MRKVLLAVVLAYSGHGHAEYQFNEYQVGEPEVSTIYQDCDGSVVEFPDGIVAISFQKYFNCKMQVVSKKGVSLSGKEIDIIWYKTSKYGDGRVERYIKGVSSYKLK